MAAELSEKAAIGSKALQWAELVPGSDRLVVGGFFLELWDLSGNVVHAFDVPRSIVWRARCTADGARLVSGHGDCKLRIWDLKTCEETGRIEQSMITMRLTLSADGKLALGQAGNNQLTCFEVDTAQVRRVEKHKKSLCNGAALHPDGNLAGYAGTDGYFRLLDLGSDAGVVAGEGQGWVNDVAVAGDGSFFATGGRAKTVLLWSCAGERIRSLSGMTSTIQCVAVSPDGDRVVACGGRVVMLWDAKTGEVVAKRRHDTGVNAVTFAPDGSTIVAATSEGARLFGTP